MPKESDFKKQISIEIYEKKKKKRIRLWSTCKKSLFTVQSLWAGTCEGLGLPRKVERHVVMNSDWERSGAFYAEDEVGTVTMKRIIFFLFPVFPYAIIWVEYWEITSSEGRNLASLKLLFLKIS